MAAAEPRGGHLDRTRPWRLALGLVMALAVAAVQAAAEGSAPSEPPGPRSPLLQLQRQVAGLQAALSALDEQVRSVQALQRAEDEVQRQAQAAALALNACLAALGRQAPVAEQAGSLDGAGQAARQAALDLARAAGGALPAALARAGASAKARQGAEDAAGQALRLSENCRDSAAQWGRRAEALAHSGREAQRAALALAEAGLAAQRAWNLVLAGSRSAQIKPPMTRRPASTGGPASDRFQALKRAADATPAAPPPWPAAPDLRPLAGAQALWLERQNELTRLRDGAAYLELAVAATPADCGDAPCETPAAQRSELERRIAAASAEAAAALEALARLPRPDAAAAAAWQAAWQKAWADQQDRLRPLQAARGPALAQAARLGERLGPAAERLALATEEALRRARPGADEPATAGGDIDGIPAAGAGTDTGGGPRAAPALGGHAYSAFGHLGEEPGGYGAYTYVLMRSAADLQRPAARRRFEQLVQRLMRNRPASRVGAGEAALLNLFCLPLLPGADLLAGGAAARYHDDLGQQLKLRANAGLLARPEMLKALNAGSGPFLLTLPVRLGEAQADTVLLLADLSQVPDDAVADLVSQYAGSLLSDFPTQRALWRPPVPQRVALTLVSLAADVSGLVQSLIPSAQAAER